MIQQCFMQNKNTKLLILKFYYIKIKLIINTLFNLFIIYL